MKLFKALIVLSIVMVSSASQGMSENEKKDEPATQQEISLKQNTSDLLAGVSKAICYSGFREGQHPDRGEGAVNPSYENTVEDLKILQDNGFKLIRLYDCGENSEMVLKVIREHTLDIKVLLGIWLKAELSAHETCGWLNEPIPDDVLAKNKVTNQAEIARGIGLANQFTDVVVAVNVGNEALVEWNDHKVDVGSMISYVHHVKEKIEQPVTVADNYDWWAKEGAELAKAVDFVSLHIYPLWEGKDIDEALTYSIACYEKAKKALPESQFVITEAGWASIASEFGERASEDNLVRYYDEYMQWSADNNITTFFFEAFDEPWKGNPDNPMGAEKHWGIFNVDRTPKKVMQNR